MIQEIDDKFQPVGKEIQVDADIICMAVGLTPTCELLWQAGCEMVFVPQLCGHVAQRDLFMRTSHPDIWVAGDAAGIEEASAAMVEGRIAGVGVARSLGKGDSSEHSKRLEEYRRRLADLRVARSDRRSVRALNAALSTSGGCDTLNEKRSSSTAGARGNAQRGS
jgi:sarcosine oxidase subunit alpha